MAYTTPPDFTPFDILTAAQLDILSNNDISFNNGTGLPVGTCVQLAQNSSSAVDSTATTIPVDDTIPQIGEGKELITASITPRSATNRLVIEVSAMVGVNNANRAIIALFQDATANALAVAQSYITTSGSEMAVPLTYSMIAGTTSSTTFRLRGGPSTTGTLTFNGTGAARLFGATVKSTIVIREYTV